MKPHVRVKNFLVYLLEAGRQVHLYFLKQRIIRREHTFRALPSLGREPEGGADAPRLLVVVTHVAKQASHHTTSKVEKLSAVLTGIRQSFAHLRYEVVINTLPVLHVMGQLPADLTAGMTIHEQDDPEPMLIEFRVQDLFAARREDFDYFLFLEDDIVVQDTLYLDKFQLFNRFTKDPKYLLMPNRYEITGAKKVYIDQNLYSKLAHLDLDGVPLSECANIHSASYLLSREQLDLWLASGRRLYRQVSYIGPLESAASGCLMEVFRIYKPAPPNLRFLEVRHHDNCYAGKLGSEPEKFGWTSGCGLAVFVFRSDTLRMITPSLPPRTGLPQAWLVVTRPSNLPTALAAADALADRYPGGCRLLLESSPWWQSARWEEYRERFAAVHTFERIRACRGLFDVVRPCRQFAERQHALAALPFDAGRDVLICLSGVIELANAASSAFRTARRLLCLPHAVHENLLRPPNRWQYRFTTAGWLQNRLIEPFAGVERTLHFKPRLNCGGDGVRLIRLHKPPEAAYDAVVVMSNTGCERPAGAGRRTFAARFPDLRDLRITTPGNDNVPTAPCRRCVVFFGTPFLLVENLPPARYAEQLNRCLDYLRRCYPDRTWIYRPHPAETGEGNALRLDGFQVETDGEAAELYCLRNFRQIEAVHSVSSTVSRVALNSGLNAYCFWRSFPFAEKQQRFFERLMGTVPAEFDLRHLSAPPLPYADRAAGTRPAAVGQSFGDALRTALDATSGRAVVPAAVEPHF